MEAADSSPAAEVSSVAVQLLPFSAERPAVWFAQAEAQFTLASISSYLISQLDHRYATEVEDIITSLPNQYTYTTLRTEFVRRLSPS
jgi:tagatose-1,6-bisphosphate aldolase non-catalytic subunit AgaZ/GatZ